MINLLIILITLTILIGFYNWKRRHLYNFGAKLPGPPATFLVGNGLDFICPNKKDVLEVILRMTESYPSPMRLWLGPRLVVFIKDADQLQIIMQSSKMTTKSYIYSFLEPFLGKGLFTSNGNIHKNHRKLLQPLFSQRILEGYSHLFQKHANKFIHLLLKHINGAPFNILPYLHDSAFEASMDIFLEDKNNHSLDYGNFPEYIRKFYDIFFNRILSFWIHPNFIYEKTKSFREQTMISDMVKKMTQEIADTKLPEILNRQSNNNKSEMDRNTTIEIRTPSIFEMMLELIEENPNCFNEQEFIDHLITFIATSQDTQSSAIAFTFMMLGLYPDIQDKVYQELNESLDGKRSPSFSDLNKLKYMEMCIKEAMRLFPLGPFLLRDTTDDFPMGKLTIPKGCTVILGIYNIHRDHQHWEKPNTFYPEHFTLEAISKRHPYAFLPFSGGPRRCIAQQYSYINMKIIIATVLQQFIIETDGSLQDIELMTDISIRPVKGYMVKIKNRC